MNYKIVLCEQDLAEFLNGNSRYMEQYREELERRLATDGDTADVEIRDTLADEIADEQLDTVLAMMGRIANDWDWLS